MSETTVSEKILEAVEFARDGMDFGYFLDTDSEHPCYVSKDDRNLRLFIECPSIDCFSDKFNGVEVKQTLQSIGGGNLKSGISLTVPKNYLRQFAILSNDLIKYRNQNENFLDIDSWCEEWKNILGNKYLEKIIYDVLGELLICCYLQERGQHPDWQGPLGGSHDILCDTFDCEVKSTINRTGSLIVHSSSSFQFNPGDNRLYLFVCRFEESSKKGICIDELKGFLIEHGMSLPDLENKLDAAGMVTSKYLGTRFKLTEDIRKYTIDSDFPRLSEDDFIDGHIPEHVVNISYCLDLEGVPYDRIRVSRKGGTLTFDN